MGTPTGRTYLRRLTIRWRRGTVHETSSADNQAARSSTVRATGAAGDHTAENVDAGPPDSDSLDAGPPDSDSLLLLLMDTFSWVHRRVERAVIEPTGESTRHVSIDFSVPKNRAFLDHGQVVVPLGVMTKGPLMRFSVTGPDGRPASVLERRTNHDLTVDALCEVAGLAIPEGGNFDTERFRELCTALVAHDRTGPDTDVDRATEAEFRILVDRLEFGRAWEKDWFVTFALGLRRSFVLLVALDADLIVERRAVVKFRYQTQLTGTRDLRAPRPTMRWPLPEIGLAKSTHFEFSPPHLLLIRDAALTADFGKGRTDMPRVWFKKERSTVHFVHQRGEPIKGWRPPRYSDPAVELTLALRPSDGALRVMRWGPLVVFGALVVGMIVRSLAFAGWIPTFTPGAGPAAVLLAGSGLLLTWIARAPEDWVTAEILYQVRAVLERAAMVAIAAACFLAVPFGTVTVLWWVRTVCWLLVVLWALYVWLESRALAASMDCRIWPAWKRIDQLGRPVRWAGDRVRARLGSKEKE